uniref:Ovule protein n=1 Tax=Heterorhabditis bacteriophora TaxID=37862 RepID=A0A1I7WI88_HETBA
MFHGNTRHTNRYRGNMDFGDTRPQCSSAKLYRLIKKCVTVTSDVTCSRQLGEKSTSSDCSPKTDMICK